VNVISLPVKRLIKLTIKTGATNNDGETCSATRTDKYSERSARLHGTTYGGCLRRSLRQWRDNAARACQGNRAMVGLDDSLPRIINVAERYDDVHHNFVIVARRSLASISLFISFFSFSLPSSFSSPLSLSLSLSVRLSVSLSIFLSLAVNLDAEQVSRHTYNRDAYNRGVPSFSLHLYDYGYGCTFMHEACLF